MWSNSCSKAAPSSCSASPAASSELSHLQVDLIAVSEAVDTLSTQVVHDERSCSVAAAKLTKLDLVKGRVLEAKSTLQVRGGTREARCACASTGLQALTECTVMAHKPATPCVQEAATLKQQYDTLNDVLERANMPQMLAALVTMKKSMDALVKVPEFSGVADKVALLESRLKALAVPKLADALRDQHGAPWETDAACTGLRGL